MEPAADRAGERPERLERDVAPPAAEQVEREDRRTDEPKPKREFSTYQHAIFADFADDSGNTVCIAVAGSGKTTTLAEGVERIPRGRSVFCCAYGSKIAKHLSTVIRRHPVKTANSKGWETVRAAFGDGVQMDEKKTRKICNRILIDCGSYFVKNGDKIPKGGAPLAKLCSWAKNHLAAPRDVARLEKMASDCDAVDDARGISAKRLAELASAVLAECLADTTTFDFDDQLWFPAMLNLRADAYDVVVIDELQDFNAAQLYMAKALCKRGGRIFGVGDPAQAIFMFRGADSEAIPRIIRETEARVLPLHYSYRCPEKVSALAREIVPAFQSAPGAAQGIVELNVDREKLIKGVRPGHMVVSRKRGPLLGLAIELVERGVDAFVVGRDSTRTQLEKLIDSSKANNVHGLIGYVQRWQDERRRAAEGLDREDKADEADDLAEAVLALARNQTDIDSVRRRVAGLFNDNDDATRVACSTVHAAKGLERDEVWMLGDTFRVKPGEGWARENRNLYYVAVTRARQALRIVGEVDRRVYNKGAQQPGLSG